MSIIDFLIGKPIATSDERAERIGVTKGIPIFGLDALSSAAYGPEAALTLLIPLAIAGPTYIVPISLSITVLLLIVFFSYRQTIAAYPGGGGSYTVAHENLGAFAGLLAGAALMIDSVLTAAVGISAGIGALTSAVPALHPRTLILCLAALAIITLVNLRGISETGAVFGADLLILGVHVCNHRHRHGEDDGKRRAPGSGRASSGFSHSRNDSEYMAFAERSRAVARP